ncbi:hypothetical protein AX15_004433 [Amanita polypyramis BW_CC]|nr:hypothetical protein AX15_004433 [Amanita polypyramis BW_CC]
MDTRPDKVNTPPAEWPLECLTTKLLTCLSTRQLREIHKFGAPSLWECLHEAGYGNEYELFNKLCTLAFLLYQPLSAEQVEQSAIDLGVTVLEGAWVSPLTFTHEDELVTPKGLKCVKHTHFMTTPLVAMEINKPGPSQTLANTQDHANQFLKRGLFLITQLHKLWTEAAETQGNTPDQLIDALHMTFHLKEVPSNTTPQVTAHGNTQTSGSATSQQLTHVPAATTLHAPQPTRPINISMPPSWTPRPTRSPREKTPYNAKGKGCQQSQTPPSSREASPRPSSSKSYASKAALTAKETLSCTQEVLSKAPSLSLDEAMAVAKTMPITATPKPNPRKLATIQGSKESSCIISTLVLLHQGLVERIQDLVLEDHQLAMLPSRIIAISNDHRSVILHTNQTPTQDDITAFHALIVNATNQPYKECLNTNRPTYSTAKIEFLPINNAITVDTIHNTLLQIEVYNDNHTNNGVQLIPHLTNKLVQTALVKIFDFCNGALLKKLCRKSITIGTDTRHIKPWINKPMARQCSICQKWGHTQQICHSQQAHITMPAGAAMPQMLTPNIAYTFAAPTAMALMRPPTPPAPGLQHKPTHLN